MLHINLRKFLSVLFVFLFGGFLIFSNVSFGYNFHEINSQPGSQNFATFPTATNNPFITAPPAKYSSNASLNPTPVNYTPNNSMPYMYGAHPAYMPVTYPNPFNSNPFPLGMATNPYSSAFSTNPFNSAINIKPYSVESSGPKYPTPGEIIPRGTDVKVLLMGQTGSGKTTFLNTAANWLFYGTFGIREEEQNIEIIVPTKYFKKPTIKGYSHSEYNVVDQGKSQTSEPKSYKMGEEGRFVTFIDTPGVADTGGIEVDDKHLDNILKDASESNISGIILFFNGADARLTATKKYSINKLKGSIPDIALKKMIVVLTHCREKSTGFPIQQIIDLGVSKDRIFFMDNSVLASDPSSWKDPRDAQYLALDWDDSMNTVGKIITKLIEDKAEISKEFKRIRVLRNQIISELHEVKLKLREIQSTQDAIEFTKAKLESQKEEAEGFKDYAKKAIVKTTKFVVDNNIKEYNTMCKVHDTICHANCGIEETKIKGDSKLTNCSAFSGSQGQRCKECSKDVDCSFSNHYHAHGSFKEVEETLQDKLLEYKKQYEDAESKALGTEAEINSAQAAIEQINLTVDQFTKKTENRLIELKQICSGFNLVAELYSTIEILEQDKNRFTSHEALKTAEQFITALKLMAERLSGNEIPKPIRKTNNNTVVAPTNNNSFVIQEAAEVNNKDVVQEKVIVNENNAPSFGAQQPTAKSGNKIIRSFGKLIGKLNYDKS